MCELGQVVYIVITAAILSKEAKNQNKLEIAD
jgi:hypothetical protein